MTDRIRWAVLGPGVIARDFAVGLAASRSGVLHAVGSRSAERAASFAVEHHVPVSGTYEQILAREDVDAVYVATVHTTHGDLALRALAAGKAVLCEKPLTPSATETAHVLDAARASGLPFLEAFKYRFGPLAERLRDLVAGGALGRVHHVDASCGGLVTQHIPRLEEPALAGGAILDVGSYPASFAVGALAWSALAHGEVLDGAAPVRAVSAAGSITPAGVDEWASAVLAIGDASAAADGRIATVSLRTAIRVRLALDVAIHGSLGVIEIPDVWGSRTVSADRLVLRRLGSEPEEIVLPTIQPMAAEADAVADALRAGTAEIPEMTWAESLLTARVLEEWRASID